ncbi:probable tRNA pseudouridine synthase 1 isoform X2 [Schistocerca piceifrons]|uniref:probable tRNA pseudouridine synthase 1 isoform X2 n=1 Tax=Schistocerca piceifrons TaxID=274613 RepID=UPI001F5E381B|nr:probable tRNA pseudouridine synthase 1 isoform X2 [Schistocerca piceifrons]XP_049778148.1 pseudouridylate synthase TRUB1-like isoform X1 [Schistocerca cancellata]XP_049958559.1 pseudouridylate synthase TRUB1-like isoform X1 [Schistocerca serialis cubense]XP_049958560.1 pseudouridylate synthase TRUB1-like isoform X1 [Schistocerca serialis cubense]
MYDLYKILNRGIFAVNKIKYFTSAEVVEQLKETIRRGVHERYLPDPFKVGHGGTLDDTATGVLVVGVGEGCQLLARFLHGNKKYVVTGCLGSETTTYNETGIHVNSAPYDHISKESLEEALMSFRGKILQTPPKYSALKMGGRRIADLTRSGINVEMKPRHVMCYNVKCTDFNPPFFKLALSCGPGFYVRSLVHDLGLALKSYAYVTELRRIQHGPFTEDDMLEPEKWTIEDIVCAIQQASEKYAEFLQNLKNGAMAG